MYDPKNVKLRFSPKDGRNYFLGLFCKYNTFTSSTDSMEVISTTTTSLWLALLANPWLLLYLTDGGNILWALSTKSRPDCARKTGWIRVKMLSLVFGERGTHVFEGGQCHRVDARKREPWGQNLLKL